MADSVAVVAVVVVVAVVAGAAPVASSVGVDAGTAAQETPVNGSDVAPGERMAGVVGAEQAAVEGEVESRAFERRVAVANSSTAKAKVVGSEVENLQARLDELADREAELRRAHENGTLSTGEYRARLARLYAEQRNLQRLANQTERAARDLPEQALRQQGVNVTALRTLRSTARNLTRPEVAEIARGIAGKNVGRPADTGPPDFVDNRTGGPGAGNGPPGDGGPPDNRSGGPGNDTGPPTDAGNGGADPGDGPPGNETGANGNGQGNGDAGPPGNETGAPGNGTGPPEDAGNGNETGTPGNGNQTGPPEDTGNGNETGGSGQGQGPAGNETGQPGGGQGEGAGNSTGSGTGNGDNGGNGNGANGASGNGGSGNGGNSADAKTTWRVD